MKAKFINENLTKFTEDSDPIEDMGIGDYPRNLKKLRDKLSDMFDKNYSKIVELDNENSTRSIEFWNNIEVIQEIQETIDKLFGKEE